MYVKIIQDPDPSSGIKSPKSRSRDKGLRSYASCVLCQDTKPLYAASTLACTSAVNSLHGVINNNLLIFKLMLDCTVLELAEKSEIPSKSKVQIF